jgi:hypothetical protein
MICIDLASIKPFWETPGPYQNGHHQPHWSTSSFGDVENDPSGFDTPMWLEGSGSELWVSRCPKRGATEFCRIKVLRKKFAMDVEEPPAVCPEDWSSCDGSCVGFLAGVQCPVL